MSDVETDVTGPLKAIAEVMQGSSAKEGQMKDGPPESQETGSSGGTKTPYDQYKDDIAKAWDNYDQHGDASQLGLDISQAIADLAMRGGGGLMEAFGKLLGGGD